MSQAIEITDADFDREVLQSSLPVLVDFWAPTCPPCRQLMPILGQLAEEYAGTVKIAKINVNEESRAATQYGVMYLPTLMLFQNGQVLEKLQRYMAMGMRAFILSGYPHLDECRLFARHVLPHLKRRRLAVEQGRVVENPVTPLTTAVRR